MKIWSAYASEHSMNLVMIGRFEEVRDAEDVGGLLERLIDQVSSEPEAYAWDARPGDRRFSDEMLELLRASKLNTIGPPELEQFGYDVRVEVKGKEVVVTTDETDISAFLKTLIEKGGRIEIYSAHDYPDTGYGH